ncbi:MAG: transcriptional regulator, AraC family [Gammaproteobacteria bacterium]|jgi:AraC family transcriptional regulator|nr:transcriptional regulator, AraC family [Gammaproteobacteria bacterium]
MTLADASDKYEVGPGRLLQSSAPRGWSNMFAEFRLHVSGRADTFVQPVTEISMVFRGEGLVRRRDSGETHTTYAKPGVIWLCSAGQQIEWLEMEQGVLEILHLYLPPAALLDYATERGFKGATGQSLRYTVNDPLLEQIGRAILSEMQAETAAGSLLVESLGSSLSARLLQSHSTSALAVAARLSSAGKLAPRRLSRVLEYIHAHLGDALDIRGMATTANLSRFHFARAFKASTGHTPYQYVSAQRLAQAKVLLAQNQPLAQIALALNFSSQANFTRAFRREFGITPGRYREQESR